MSELQNLDFATTRLSYSGSVGVLSADLNDEGTLTGRQRNSISASENQNTEINSHNFFIQYEKLEFERLVNAWKKEKKIMSSSSEMAMCLSYQRIIGMGEKAIPLIFDQLAQEGDEPDHWFWALETITGINPIPEDAYGDMNEMASAWILWAKKNNVW